MIHQRYHFYPVLVTCLFIGVQNANAEEQLPKAELLWPNGAPGGGEPKITQFLPDKANGTAVIVCPGGSYKTLAAYEGVPVAQWLNTIGVAGIVW